MQTQEGWFLMSAKKVISADPNNPTTWNQQEGTTMNQKREQE